LGSSRQLLGLRKFLRRGLKLLKASTATNRPPIDPHPKRALCGVVMPEALPGASLPEVLDRPRDFPAVFKNHSRSAMLILEMACEPVPLYLGTARPSGNRMRRCREIVTIAKGKAVSEYEVGIGTRFYGIATQRGWPGASQSSHTLRTIFFHQWWAQPRVEIKPRRGASEHTLRKGKSQITLEAV